MPECDNPLWPCAMTGAAACLAGFEGITVVIHGSSGCYYYPTTLLHAPLEGTFIMESEVIFGSENRLREVIDGLSGKGNRIAVVNTCVPAVLGEDIRSMLASHDVLIVDSPGFAGDVEAGYAKALVALSPSVNPESCGVNIDGACIFDPFFRGNIQEVSRLLRLASVPVGTVFCSDRLGKVQDASPFTIGTNRDFASGVGEFLGGTLGTDEIAATFENIGMYFDDADIDPVLRECERDEERIIQACDKFLRRFDPPRVAIFGGLSYSLFARKILKNYLDADIVCIGTRNDPGGSPGTGIDPGGSPGTTWVQGMNQVKALIGLHKPDLIIGSSFEQSAAPAPAPGFIGLVPPVRGRVRLAPRTIAGISGTLSFTEDVLNECMNRRGPGVSGTKRQPDSPDR